MPASAGVVKSANVKGVRVTLSVIPDWWRWRSGYTAEAEGWPHVVAGHLGRVGNPRGLLNENGRPFAAASVKSMLD
jgi:hypothetical protein